MGLNSGFKGLTDTNVHKNKRIMNTNVKPAINMPVKPAINMSSTNKSSQFLEKYCD